MSYPINYPTPQGANVQIFSEGGTTSDWVKPRGASFVWFTLIGGGGNGNLGTVSGGGSGAVTNFMCPSFLIPDVLRISVSSGDSSNTTIVYQQKDVTGYTLLTAASGVGVTAGAATSANAFTAIGFFQSVAGQNGVTTAQSASTTTFLSGGSAGTTTANYGYQAVGYSGYFQMQPIIVGVGGGSTATNNGGIGCGGGADAIAGKGGPGLVVIITW